MNPGRWQPGIITRFVQLLPTSTNVVRVDTHAGEGFLKAIGNPEGPHALACELVGTQLAEWLGLRTLEYAVVEVTDDDEIPLTDGRIAMPGPAFITRAEKGFSWGGDADLLRRIRNPEDISGLVALDTWIRNCDRFRPEPRLRINRDNVFLTWEREQGNGPVLRAIDHTHAFTCGGDLTRRIGHLDEIRDATVYGCFPEFLPFLDPAHVAAATNRLGGMTMAIAERVVASVPGEWQVEESAREAWVRFISERAMFVAGSLPAWLAALRDT